MERASLPPVPASKLKLYKTMFCDFCTFHFVGCIRHAGFNITYLSYRSKFVPCSCILQGILKFDGLTDCSVGNFHFCSIKVIFRCSTILYSCFRVSPQPYTGRMVLFQTNFLQPDIFEHDHHQSVCSPHYTCM